MNDSPSIPPSRLQARKHAAITAAAQDVFLAAGFEAASMDEVAAAATVSKATLYKHFPSKDALFVAVMEARYAGLAAAVGDIDPSLPPQAALSGFAGRLIAEITSPAHIALVRVIIGAAARHPAVSAAFFATGKGAALRSLVTYLDAKVAARQFAIPDTSMAGLQFLGLIKEPLFWPPIFGGTPRGTPEAVIADAAQIMLAQWSVPTGT